MKEKQNVFPFIPWKFHLNINETLKWSLSVHPNALFSFLLSFFCINWYNLYFVLSFFISNLLDYSVINLINSHLMSLFLSFLFGLVELYWIWLVDIDAMWGSWSAQIRWQHINAVCWWFVVNCHATLPSHNITY